MRNSKNKRTVWPGSRLLLGLALALAAALLLVWGVGAAPPQDARTSPAWTVGAAASADPIFAFQIARLSPAGQSVAMQGDTVVIGVTDTLFVFERNRGGPDNWGLTAVITPTGQDPQESCYGMPLAIDGDIVVAGCPVANVFERNRGGPDNWGAVKQIAGAVRAVDVSGERIVIGDYFYSAGSYGAAQLFERNQGGTDNWGLVKEIRAPDRNSDTFGRAVALDGDTLAVGAPGWPDRAGPGGWPELGSVYVFRRDQGGAEQWGLVTQILPSAWDQDFGDSVALDGELIAASAPVALASSGGAAAYLFGRDVGGPGRWGELQALQAGGVSQYVSPLALAGNYLLVAAPYYNTGLSDRGGAVYVFAREADGYGPWAELQKLSPTQPVTSWGNGLALSGNLFALASGQLYELRRTRLLPREAEDGALEPPMEVGEDAEASGGRYVFSPPGIVGGSVTIVVDVAVAGDYEVWGRVRAESSGRDSFYVRMDGVLELVWDVPIGEWRWVPVVDRDHPERAQLYSLSSGEHELQVLGRESGAALDAIELRLVAPEEPLPQPSPTATPLHTPTPTTTPVAPCSPPAVTWPLSTTQLFCDVPVTFTWSGDCAAYLFQFGYGGDSDVRSSGWITATQWGPLLVRSGAWRVKGRNDARAESEWSAFSSFYAENRPTNVQARGVSCDQIEVTMYGSPCAQYQYYRAICGDKSCATAESSNTCTVKGLESGRTYSCYAEGYRWRPYYEWSAPSVAVTATTLGPNLSQEAEDGVIVAPMVAGEDPDASHGHYVYSPVANEGQVTLHLCSVEAGDYELWARAAADGTGSDTFWVRMDSGTDALWEVPEGPWAWAPVTHRDDAGQNHVQVYSLGYGSHSIEVRAREAGARLDMIELRPAGQPWPTETPTLTPSPTAEPTHTSTLTATPSASPTATGTLTATPTASPSATGTSTATPTATLTPTVTPVPRWPVYLPLLLRPPAGG